MRQVFVLDNSNLLYSTFFSHYIKEYNELLSNPNIQFAYYSSLDIIHNVLTKKEIWLRNISVMNDYQEVIRGIEQLKKHLYKDDFQLLKQFVDALQDVYYSFPWEQNLLEFFEEGYIRASFDTYLTSFTKHHINQKEGRYGRLSMWRAYGRGISGATVFDKKTILKDLEISELAFSAIAYFEEDEIEKELNALIRNIEVNASHLKTYTPNQIWQELREALLFAVISTKKSLRKNKSGV